MKIIALLLLIVSTSALAKPAPGQCTVVICNMPKLNPYGEGKFCFAGTMPKEVAKVGLVMIPEGKIVHGVSVNTTDSWVTQVEAVVECGKQ